MTPEFKDETIRETSASSWRIIYRIQDAQIYILAIVHKRRVIEGQQFIS
jgi:plasmid stabilization system protein ParE